MAENCPDCGTEMLPADDMACARAKWVCPECAPSFVLEDATTVEMSEI